MMVKDESVIESKQYMADETIVKNELEYDKLASHTYDDDKYKSARKSRKYKDDYSGDIDYKKSESKQETEFKKSESKQDTEYKKSRKYEDDYNDDDRKSRKSRKYEDNYSDDDKKSRKSRKSKKYRDRSDEEDRKSKKYRDRSDEEDRKSKKYRDRSDDEDRKSKKYRDRSDDEDRKSKNNNEKEYKSSDKRKKSSNSKSKKHIDDSDDELYNRLLEKKMRGNSYNEKSSSREHSPKHKSSKSNKSTSSIANIKTEPAYTKSSTKQEPTLAATSESTTNQTQPPNTSGRVKKSRWGNDSERAVIPGIPVAIGKELSDDQQKLYLLQFKIEEIGLKLRTGNLGIKPEDSLRSPSPEPIYNSQGIRQNTREARVRQRLDEERHRLIREALKINPEYIPPADFKPNSHRFTDKVPIPQSIHPNVNFIGLIIGPRGNTLKKLETETGCKIIIRGQGSLKDGKANGLILPGADEPLHALITAMNEDCLRRGIATINKIINDGLSNPDGDNELRRSQLRELALLNGTLIASEVSRCKNCGSGEHRHWECPHQQNLTSIITCSKCGGAGHLDSDCIFQGERAQTAEEKSKMDLEYQDLMEELGVKRNEITFETKTNIPSILALPKYMVSQLPWVNTASGNLGSTYPPTGPLALPPTTIIPSAGHSMMPTQPIIPGAPPIIHAMPPANSNFIISPPPPPPPPPPQSYPNTNNSQPPYNS